MVLMNKHLTFIIILPFVTNACNRIDAKKTGESTIILSDMQVTACNTANDASTCDTRLAELGIVLKEDCCKALGKCC